MGRKAIHGSDAERQAAYRERQRIKAAAEPAQIIYLARSLSSQIKRTTAYGHKLGPGHIVQLWLDELNALEDAAKNAQQEQSANEVLHSH